MNNYSIHAYAHIATRNVILFAILWFGMKTLTYRIHLEPEPEGGFTVTVPALPGCITYGETWELAVERAHEAIEGFIETLIQLGKLVPGKRVAR